MRLYLFPLFRANVLGFDQPLLLLNANLLYRVDVHDFERPHEPWPVFVIPHRQGQAELFQQPRVRPFPR